MYCTNHRIVIIALERAHRFYLANDWIFSWSPLGRQTKECVQQLHKFTNGVIRNRRQILQGANNTDKETTDGARPVDSNATKESDQVFPSNYPFLERYALRWLKFRVLLLACLKRRDWRSSICC